jgi:dihydropteroate synthase
MKRTERLKQGDRPLIMGILNVTPDSFSDGGLYMRPLQALARAERMIKEGADILDIGGESTRPGSDPVSVGEQRARVVPVLENLRRNLAVDCLISIDTTQSKVAEVALAKGADIINDVSAGRDDPAMFSLVAERDVPLILMHMQGTPKTMQEDPRYQAVLDEVLAFLEARAAAALRAGVREENIILDPGIGFGKRREDNLALLAGLDRLVATGRPVLLGASRKRFMGAICSEARADELVAATVATTALGVMSGVRIFRVHDVRENRQAADVAYEIRKARRGAGMKP